LACITDDRELAANDPKGKNVTICQKMPIFFGAPAKRCTRSEYYIILIVTFFYPEKAVSGKNIASPKLVLAHQAKRNLFDSLHCTGRTRDWTNPGKPLFDKKRLTP